jgi:hypothetical protein
MGVEHIGSSRSGEQEVALEPTSFFMRRTIFAEEALWSLNSDDAPIVLFYREYGP